LSRRSIRLAQAAQVIPVMASSVRDAVGGVAVM
jgi:hypothetical protein